MSDSQIELLRALGDWVILVENRLNDLEKKTEVPKVEISEDKPEPKKVKKEEPNVEAPKVEAPKVEAPKTETPKTKVEESQIPKEISQKDLITLVKAINGLNGQDEIMELCKDYGVDGLSKVPKEKWGSLYCDLSALLVDLDLQ